MPQWREAEPKPNGSEGSEEIGPEKGVQRFVRIMDPYVKLLRGPYLGAFFGPPGACPHPVREPWLEVARSILRNATGVPSKFLTENFLEGTNTMATKQMSRRTAGHRCRRARRGS